LATTRLREEYGQRSEVSNANFVWIRFMRCARENKPMQRIEKATRKKVARENA
jgi:hypothetical protein